MEDNNNNMEEFFKRSLERFDEAPSDDVWTNVSDRLTIEAKWYDPILSIVKLAYPFLLAGLVIGIYHLYTNNKLTSLQNSLSEATSTIDILQQEKKEYNESVNSITTLKENLLAKINDKNLEIEKIIQDYNVLDKSYSSLKKKVAARNYTSISATDNSQLDQLLKENLLLREKLSAKEKEMLALINKGDSEMGSPSQRKTDVVCLSCRNLPGVRSYKILDDIATGSEYKIMPVLHNATEEVEVDWRLKNKRLKFGIKARYFNTLVKNADLVNPGYSRGIRTEFNLRNNLAITGDLLYNNQGYSIKSGSTTFERESLERYPGGLEENTNVNVINTRTRYFDGSLGFKYMPNYGEDKMNFFVNPSVVWQLYLPQEFQYNLTQESNISYVNKSYTLYFGSGNLSLGVEKKLSPNMKLQVSLWGEQSFIPLGYEKQYVRMFGAGTALLF